MSFSIASLDFFLLFSLIFILDAQNMNVYVLFPFIRYKNSKYFFFKFSFPIFRLTLKVPIIENTICQDMFEHAGHKKKILPSFLCAGYANGQKDSCEVIFFFYISTFLEYVQIHI